jgi:hypothetical protein
MATQGRGIFVGGSTLSDHKTQSRSQTVTTTTTERATDLTPGSLDILTPQEEKALRMLHGLTEGDGHVLKFAVGASAETRAQLALLERHIMEAMASVPVKGSVMIDEPVEENETKDKIIAHLLDSKK